MMKNLFNLKQRTLSVQDLLFISCVFLSMTTLAHARNYKEQQAEANHINNTLILNQGKNQHIIAKNQDLLNGNKSFESKLTTPGVTITEKIQQQANGHHIQENKIVVNIGDNESVQFIQKFDGEGKKISRSVIQQSSGSYPTSETSSTRKQDTIVASEGGKNPLAIEQNTRVNTNGKFTTTTIRSDHFIYASGDKNWMLTASGGYTFYANALSSDGSTGVGRLSISRTLLRTKGIELGLEAGIQNGVSMRPVVQANVLEALGGPAIQANIKPVYEVLPTLTKKIPGHDYYSAFAKMGIAVRTMTFDRDTIPNITRVSPDLHLGFASEISENIKLMIYYQVIFGGAPGIRSTLIPLPANNLGRANNIPTEQGILLGAGFRF